MRWVTFDYQQIERVGVLREGDMVFALAAGIRLIDLIADGADALASAGQQALDDPDLVVPLGDVVLRAPIPRSPAIRDCLCFLDHMRNIEQAAGRGRTLADRWYEIPAFYFACPTTVIGPHDDAPIAPGSAWFDFELEIAAVIGAGGTDLTLEQAQNSIIGYTIYNDWTARDLQIREASLAIGQAKGKDCAVTLGPYLVTPDELMQFHDGGRLALSVTAVVNGKPIGSGNTADMDWSFAEVISYASRGVELRPGEIFGSGTVPTCTLVEHLDLGNLAAFPGWLRDGDVVALEVEGLGRTEQRVRATPKPHPLPLRKNPDAKPRPMRVNPAPTPHVPFTKGLHDLGHDVWTWLAPDGGYGWSNAGLIGGDGASLLVDTLFDLTLTQEMLAAMSAITDGRPLSHAVITHSNGDHTHGNQLLGQAVQIIAAAETDHEIRHEISPDLLQLVLYADLGPELGPYARERFGPFDFGGITLRAADMTFDRELTVNVGGREVRVLNLGPAHTGADSVVHVPDAGVLFAGDLLFIGCTPVVWEGPLSNWVRACDAMLALGADTVVPGHGPVTDAAGIRGVREYLSFVIDASEQAHQKGLSFIEAAAAIDLGEYAKWLDAERIVANVYCHYRQIEPETPELNLFALLALQAQWLTQRG